MNVSVTNGEYTEKTVLSIARLAKFFGIARNTMGKYIHQSDLVGVPKVSKYPKYAIGDVASMLGISKDDLDNLLNKANEANKEAQ